VSTGPEDRAGTGSASGSGARPVGEAAVGPGRRGEEDGGPRAARTAPVRALVVGGTAGIGRAVARQLAAEGVAVTVVGRNAEAGAALAAETGAAFVRADVSLLAEARRVADAFAAADDRLHLLVHTADVIPRQRRETAEGLEVSFATNFLSRFVLNERLLPLLRAGAADAAGARLVHVAAASGSGRLDLDRVPPGPSVGAFAAHGAGQGANDLYGVELARRVAGSGVRVHVLNPGGVDTGIRREVEGTLLGRVLIPLFGLVMRTRTPEESARDVLAAVRRHPDAVLLSARGAPITPKPRLVDPARGAELWRRAEAAVDRVLAAGDRAGADGPAPGAG
jgi:NAD(P)-dependent dehydrogenase (short-subunit alcohol dehydrogenase family)